jgi:hypothetical protein
MAFNMAKGIESVVDGVSDFLFKGTAQSAVGVGTYSASFIGGKIGQHTDSAAARSLFMKAHGPGLHKNVFFGAALGLGFSAVGLGLRGLFGSDKVQEEGPLQSVAKGGVIGGATGLGLMASFGINDMFKRKSFQTQTGLLAEKSGIVGKAIARGPKFLGSGLGLGVMAGGVAVGGGYQLLKSIISTNLTRPTD